jgi:hypothetical protein
MVHRKLKLKHTLQQLQHQQPHQAALKFTHHARTFVSEHKTSNYKTQWNGWMGTRLGFPVSYYQVHQAAAVGGQQQPSAAAGGRDDGQ